MNKINKIITLILCIIICLCFTTNTLAAEASPTITLTNTSAMPNDTVTIDVDIQNNPGIMGMAFSVVYDSDAFEFVYPEDDIYGGWLTGMTVKNHPDKDCVIFVYVTNDKKNPDNNTNGKMLSATFKVKEKAAPGKHVITLGNNNYKKYGNKLHNSFSNSKQKYIVPTVKSGSITVGENCTNAGHKYGDWVITKPADCHETGLKSHTCTRDENLCIKDTRFEEVEIPITHDFEEEWTVDEVATPEKDGVMTRHCKKCDEKIDRITFSYEEIGGTETTPSMPDTSDTSSAESNTPTNSSSNNTSSNASSAPTIDNTVGGKNPFNAVVNLKDFQDSILPNYVKPPTTQEDSNNSSQQETSSTTSNIEVESKPNEIITSTPEDNSFWSTPTGITIAIISGILSVGIIALGIFLVIKGKS